MREGISKELRLVWEEWEWILAHPQRCIRCGHLLIFTAVDINEDAFCLLDGCDCRGNIHDYRPN